MSSELLNREVFDILKTVKSIYKCNGSFKTKFLAQGPNQKFAASLYAVNHTHHTEILKWFEECRINKNHADISNI